MESSIRRLASVLVALILALIALAMLWIPFTATAHWAGSGWWVWLLWVAAVPAALLLVGAWVVARAAARDGA